MRAYEGVRVAVLGASGFIGRWMARKLSAAGACAWLIVRNATAIGDPNRGRVVEVDLMDPTAVADLYSRLRPAITFNLAGYGVDPSEGDERIAWKINSEFPRWLCECAARSQNASWPGMHIVHAGSAGEYGLAGGDLREDGAAEPFSVYGKSKLAGTRNMAECSAAVGLRTVTARLFTVYGPGEHAGRLLPSLIEASRTRQPLDLSAGLQSRDFTYVEDVAEGLLRLGVIASGSRIVNVATGRLTTVRRFAETAARILGIPRSNLRFGAVPARSHEMEHEAVSVARLRQLVQWIPPTSIAEGIRKSVGGCDGQPTHGDSV